MIDAKLRELIEHTHAGPVFGRGVALPPMNNNELDATLRRASVMAEDVGVRLQNCLRQALPEASNEAVDKRARAIIAKAVSFCAALAPEVQDTERLALTALAIACMYAADEGMDRGDHWMELAVKTFCGDRPAIPKTEIELVTARTNVLACMKDTIRSFARPDDFKHVLVCYDQLVLHNEARLERLSSRFLALPEGGRPAFLAQHGRRIAQLMVADAGFQSVTASLHTVRRHEDRALVSIRTIHTHPQMARLIQMCNASARVADEWGDRWMDAGNDPAKGVFSINPFNQYDAGLVRTLCLLAHIHEPDKIASVQQAFQTQNGQYVTKLFFEHVRDHINNLPPALTEKFEYYIVLCRRVLEISHVNMQGDIALGGGSED